MKQTHFLLTVSLISFGLIFSLKEALAFNVSNDTYTIQSPDILQPETQPQYTPSEADLGTLMVSLDSDQLSFEPLTPTNPLIRKQKLVLKSQNVASFTLFPLQEEPFTNENNTLIQPTSCDEGECFVNQPAIWTNTLTYGFGYRCEKSEACEEEFVLPESYKPLPNDQLKMSEDDYVYHLGSDNQVNFIYKLNVSVTQQTGNYESEIQYTILPSL